MEIYVDVIIIENFIINLFLLLLTFRLLRFQYKNSGIYIGALIGSLYTLVIFIDVNFLTSIVVKVFIAFAMIFISINTRKIINILKSVFAFFLISFSLCGLCFGLVVMQNNYVIGESFSINKYSIKWLLLSLMIFYIVTVRFSDYLKERALIKNFIYDIYINAGGKILTLKAFLDTGNELRESVSNLPCIIIEDKYLEDIKVNEKDKYIINYNTISECGKLQGFKGDKIMIRNSLKDEWRAIDAIICGSPMTLSKDNDYQALLSRGVI